MIETYNYLIPIVFGLITGSFLNVCIYRLPENKSIVSPGSHCPSCGHPIAWYDNIPLLSYILLGGRCRHCKIKISLQYPIVEALTASLFLLIGLIYPPLETPEFWIYSLFISSLIVVSFIDLKHYIIPDVITYPGIPIGLLLSWRLTDVGLKNAVIGSAAGLVLLLTVAVGYRIIAGREGMGGGDIKLAGMIGAFTGLEGVLFSILAGALAGSIIGSLFLAITGKGSRTPIPFGPFLSFGAILFILFGKGWLNYLIALRY